MPFTSCADLQVVTTLEHLPPEALALLDDAPGIFASRSWWQVVLAHAMPAGATPAFVQIRSAGRVVALLPLLRTANRLTSLTTPYSCDYTPLLAAGLDPPARLAAMTAFARFCRGHGMVRLDALPVECSALEDLRAGARQAGLRVLHFEHFGNWQEEVKGLDWSTYLHRRPGALRETIRRRLRRAEKLPDARFDLLTEPDQLDIAAGAFESVYRRSWKQPEPFPSFNVALMRAMATQRTLRFGLWSIGADPVAVQIWVLKDGHAIVLKLAHDEAFKAHSPGTVLTALMLRHLLDHDHAEHIDFGRGDDAYKQGWATQRRRRIGLLLINPRSAAGAAHLLRHAAGRLRDALRRRTATA
ncbi:GNAT family N-acetyltransferase [Rhodopila sp.]|uniref:GNAT family N-acetyltransferase n=1 Tax=Rhodopila sp. TaxID=2480087 RepID=UPI003D0D199B